jgi:hypothetical protein
MYVYVVNGRLGRVRATIVTVERQEYSIFSVYTCSIRCTACNAHAPYCHLCPVRLYNIFSKLSHKGTIFEKKKLLNIKCVFCFSLQLLSDNICHSTNNSASYYQTVHRSSCKVLVILVRFNETRMFSTYYKKILKYQTS